jgi:hypothetical protein
MHAKTCMLNTIMSKKSLATLRKRPSRKHLSREKDLQKQIDELKREIEELKRKKPHPWDDYIEPIKPIKPRLDDEQWWPKAPNPWHPRLPDYPTFPPHFP